MPRHRPETFIIIRKKGAKKPRAERLRGFFVMYNILVKLFNLTKETLISDNINGAKSFSDKLLGMHKKSNLGGLIFKTRFGIHTFFMKDPMDIVVLDNNFKVVKIGIVKPNRLFFWHLKYRLVLELPQGAIKASKTECDDTLKIT